MPAIHDNIFQKALDFKLKFNIDPNVIYVGELEFEVLIAYAVENNYMAYPTDKDLTGDERPEVHGLKVYAVNAPRFLECGNIKL